MLIVRRLADLPAGLKTVAAIGIFDGLHRGHRRLLRTAVQMAAQRHLESWAITFDPHPLTLHRPEMDVRLITSLADRLKGMQALGLDGVLVVEYNWELARMTPAEFYRDYFRDGLGAQSIVVGEDIRFGRDNCGDLNTLRELAALDHSTVKVIPTQSAETGERFSSTRIRALLAAGQVRAAEQILGRPHRVRGTVVHGEKRGRKLGFPTANLDAEQVGVVPADGVYAGWLNRYQNGAESRLPAAISVGTNPHFEGQKRTIEAHVLGRADLNLYGEVVAIDFVERLREMQSFASLEDLLAQMDQDLLEAAARLGVPAAGRVDPAAVTA